MLVFLKPPYRVASLQSTAKMVIPLPLLFTLRYFFSLIFSYSNCVFSVSCSAFQEVRWDREGCPNQLRQGIWQARRHCRRHWPEQSNSPPPPKFLPLFTFTHTHLHVFLELVLALLIILIILGSCRCPWYGEVPSQFQKAFPNRH